MNTATVSLSNPFPNPTTAGVSLLLALRDEEDVRMSVVDLQGREVWSAPPRRYAAGRWALGWDGRATNGPVRSGLYFTRVRVGTQSYLRRLALIR